MHTRRHICIGSVVLLLTSSFATPGYSQGFRGIAVQAGVSGSVPVGDAGFRRAFDTGLGASVAAAYGWSGRLRSWIDVEIHEYDYDRQRFFDQIGLPDVDLSTQIDAAMATWSAMVGIDLTPWRVGPLVPYFRTGLGYYHRDSGATTLLILFYCTPATEVSSDYIGIERGFVAPDFCSEARREVGPDVVGVGYQVGLGTSLELKRGHSGFVDLRLGGPLSATDLTTLHLRAGMIVHR
jgi:hypothetical protein